MKLDKNYMPIISVFFFIFFLASCEWKISGLLTARDNIIFNIATSSKVIKERTKKGLPLTETLVAGQYRAQINPDKNFIELAIDTPAKKDLKIKFLLPPGAKLPKNGGELFLSHKETSQLYDAKATMNVEVVDGPLMRAYEACSVIEYYEKCSCQTDGRVVCPSQSLVLNGDKDVEYFNRTVIRDLAITLLYADSNQSAADFTGKRYDSTKIYTYQGDCFLNSSSEFRLREIIRQSMRENQQIRRECRPVVTEQAPEA